MSSWGNNDNAANAPYWAVSTVINHNAVSASAPTAANVALLYGNTQFQAYTQDTTIGLFMVDATETGAGGDNVTDVSLSNYGSGYVEAPGVTFSGGGGSSAAASASISNGQVSNITVTNVGSGYTSDPTVTIQVPVLTVPTSGVTTATDTITYNSHGQSAGAALTYNNGGGTTLAGLTSGTTYYAGQVTANTFKLYASAFLGQTAIADKTIATSAVNTTADTITITSHGLVTGASLNYNNQGGTTLAGLTSGTDYYVIVVDANTIKLATSSANATAGIAIDLTGQGNNSQTFASTGRYDLTGTGNNGQYFVIVAGTRATAIADRGLSQGQSGAEHTPHIGWNIKKVGAGGRAGRVQYETLVALSTINGDGSDDITLPDA